MKKAYIIILTAIFVPFLSVAQETKVKEKSPNAWNTYPEGSWVIIKDEQLGGGRKISSTLKYLKNIHGEIEVHKKTENGFEEDFGRSYTLGGFDPRGSKEFGEPVVEQVKLTIDGKDYNCDLETYTFSEEVSGTEKKEAVIKYWRCKDVLLPLRTVGKKGPDLALGQHVLKVYFKNDFPKVKE